MKKLNDNVHCTSELVFVPGTVDSVAHSTYKHDTLNVGTEVVNAEELYSWLAKHYEAVKNDNRCLEAHDRKYACTSSLF